MPRRPHPLKERIRKAGLIQLDVAFDLGVHPTWLSQLLNDGQRMGDDMARRIEKILEDAAVEAA